MSRVSLLQQKWLRQRIWRGLNNDASAPSVGSGASVLFDLRTLQPKRRKPGLPPLSARLRFPVKHGQA